jgi:hypothetical protein
VAATRVYLVAEAKRLNSRKGAALVVAMAAQLLAVLFVAAAVAPSPACIAEPLITSKALDTPNGIRTKPVQALVRLAAAYAPLPRERSLTNPPL